MIYYFNIYICTYSVIGVFLRWLNLVISDETRFSYIYTRKQVPSILPCRYNIAGLLHIPRSEYISLLLNNKQRHFEYARMRD